MATCTGTGCDIQSDDRNKVQYLFAYGYDSHEFTRLDRNARICSSALFIIRLPLTFSAFPLMRGDISEIKSVFDIYQIILQQCYRVEQSVVKNHVETSITKCLRGPASRAYFL